ncbi:MAG: tRNA (adenosine(37)-N6)-dimethylallyltransferase MiaA [Spirochaetes bacterium]|nr:tRNA (adenosine(37)-N6)-dimethylallyltransferase MiaA [Spirochaetota bacterium]
MVGPTAVGKTELSLELASLGFEIISADSVQVYRYLDIGSGKPTVWERTIVRHYCIDIVDPDYNFTAGDFCRYADESVREIERNGKLPLFVGGTGLYINAYFFGLSGIPLVDESIKRALKNELKERGLRALYEELRIFDPVFAGRIHQNDTQRILRGLEVFRQCGKPLSSFFGKTERRITNSTLFIGLRLEREQLRKRINQRVDAMLKEGLVEEVQKLREKGYGPDLKSMRSIGYAETNQYLDGCITRREELAERIKINTARYAKRQMTWFKKNEYVKWFTSDDRNEIYNLIEKWKLNL